MSLCADHDVIINPAVPLLGPFISKIERLYLGVYDSRQANIAEQMRRVEEVDSLQKVHAWEWVRRPENNRVKTYICSPGWCVVSCWALQC